MKLNLGKYLSFRYRLKKALQRLARSSDASVYVRVEYYFIGVQLRDTLSGVLIKDNP